MFTSSPQPLKMRSTVTRDGFAFVLVLLFIALMFSVSALVFDLVGPSQPASTVEISAETPSHPSSLEATSLISEQAPASNKIRSTAVELNTTEAEADNAGSQQNGKKRCVSLAYNKPAKTGSTTVGKLLNQRFPKAKRVDCGVHSEHSSLGKLLQANNSQYDIFDCHSIWDATMLSALVEQAKHPIVHITTIRNPVDQLFSLFFHVHKSRVCNSGNVPDAEEMLKFVRQVYNPRIQTFHSRPYNASQVGSKLVDGECAFWDVIWMTDDLEAALGSGEHFNTGKLDCPERDSMAENKELLAAIAEATKGEHEMFEGLQKCEKVVTDTPWVWDDTQGCIAEI